ncbi:MAG: hypothetical protein SGJ27_28015 [Candidatus Melainabacteria bacterium]|nr:hypothetical protein [Candidatus Melainabacteria bacterium]
MLNRILSSLTTSLKSYLHQCFEKEEVPCPKADPHNPSFTSDSLGGFHKIRPLRLVAYSRTGHDLLADEQEKKIIDYCSEHNHKIIGVFGKHGNSKTARQQAFEAMREADGLITSDLMRLFCHDTDPVRELIQQIHENFFHRAKQLIAIDNGVDTATAHGQSKVMNFLNELTDNTRKPAEGLHNIEAEQLTALDTMYEATST